MSETAKQPPPAPAAPPAPPQPAIQLPKAPDGQMTLRVNGKDHFIEPKKYRSLIEALRELGYDIPHFCYHPGLQPDGNCRMCYVNVIDVMTGKPVMVPNLSKQPFQMYPKPVISCREPLNPRGMVVETETPAVIEARKWVMEFLLINHPLDCPVCDKAGECLLQDNSFGHGKADSRFEERKNEKPPKDLGPTIKLWTDRCITCTRCTRFLDEVSGTSELYVVQRGDRSEIDIAPGHPVDNPLMGNIVDICPVGALIDKDLMYSYRAWYLQRTDSVCPGCSKGCNIQVQAQKEFVRRLVPRENRDVNGWWICDRGRKDFGYIHAENRLRQARLDGKDTPVIQAAEEAGKRLRAAADKGAQGVAILASAWLTLEELYLVKRLAAALGNVPVGLLTEPDGQEQTFPKFKIEADRNPNRAGAKRVLGDEVEAKTAGILEAAQAGTLAAVYVISSMPHFEPTVALLDALNKVSLLVVQDLRPGTLTEKAQVVLPGASFAEKDGVFVNVGRRAQVVRRAIDPLAQGHDDLLVLQRVARAAGAEVSDGSAREVFRELAKEIPALNGADHKALGRGGLAIQ
jgi:NADH-quinone oxidoreductase subunit G